MLSKPATIQEINKKLSTKEMMLKIIKNNRSVTRVELNAIKQHLVNLKKEGLIERVGRTKSGHWEVNR